jgi:hypothetical protein
VHPDFREVIPLMPEPILKQDGETKNDDTPRYTPHGAE